MSRAGPSTSNDVYPDAVVDSTTVPGNGTAPQALGTYVDNWPKDPWTNVKMVGDGSQGNYTYVSAAPHDTFTLTGFYKGGTFIVP